MRRLARRRPSRKARKVVAVATTRMIKPRIPKARSQDVSQLLEPFTSTLEK